MDALDQIPDETVMCHRTGFQTSCRDLVLSRKCRRWKNVVGSDPQDKTKSINQYGCIDDFAQLLQIALIGEMRTCSAEVLRLRNELLDQVTQRRVVAERRQRFEELESTHVARLDHS